jgi:hypothetical protein
MVDNKIAANVYGFALGGDFIFVAPELKAE